jgi:hypothetical protein
MKKLIIKILAHLFAKPYVIEVRTIRGETRYLHQVEEEGMYNYVKDVNNATFFRKQSAVEILGGLCRYDFGEKFTVKKLPFTW